MITLSDIITNLVTHATISGMYDNYILSVRRHSSTIMQF